MKRVTVKDKILLHLQQFKDIEQRYDNPFELTQDGIAHSVGISRSHVALNIVTLKKKNYIKEHLAQVIGAARQRKVYFLTRTGLEYVNELRESLFRRTVMFRDIEGNISEIKMWDLVAYLYPFSEKYITILEIIKHLSEDDIFDSKSYLEKVKKEKKEVRLKP